MKKGDIIKHRVNQCEVQYELETFDGEKKFIGGTIISYGSLSRSHVGKFMDVVENWGSAS